MSAALKIVYQLAFIVGYAQLMPSRNVRRVFAKSILIVIELSISRVSFLKTYAELRGVI